jgi:NarL family two-component system response regulator LiaR
MLEKRIRIMLVDDHAVVRSGLGAFILAHDDFELVGETSSGERAITLCQQTEPDVVLMDLMMPGMGGTAATRLIRKIHPNTQVIALTSYKEKELVEGVLKAGAIGYLLKDVSADELVKAIRSAVAGKPTLAPEAQQVLIEGTRSPADKPGFDLTGRERDVLALIVQGRNNSQIAKQLVISLSTAKFHVSSILSKLHATTRAEAVSIALKNHLVE